MEIYYKNTIFYLTDQLGFNKDRRTIIFKSPADFKTLIKQNKNGQINIYHHSINTIKKNLLKRFKPIYASGGIVKNSSNETLFIYRNGVWDLPKGKSEKNEFIEETAIREVSEETGLKEIQIQSFNSESYHLYKDKGKIYLKIVFWYDIYTEKNIKLTPQKKEGITKVEWVKPDDITKTIENSYMSIKNLFKTI